MGTRHPPTPGRTGLKAENMVEKSMLGERGWVSERGPGLMGVAEGY